MRIEIAPAGPAQAPAIARLAAESLPDAWSEAGYREELERPHSLALLARQPLAQQPDSGDPLGFALGSRVLDEAELLALAVHPRWRRRGVGTALLEAFLAGARAAGVARLTLEVRASNQPALLLYERLGFARLGERARYYAGGETALLYGARL